MMLHQHGSGGSVREWNVIREQVRLTLPDMAPRTTSQFSSSMPWVPVCPISSRSEYWVAQVGSEIILSMNLRSNGWLIWPAHSPSSENHASGSAFRKNIFLRVVPVVSQFPPAKSLKLYSGFSTQELHGNVVSWFVGSITLKTFSDLCS